jgi:hypothetical protein
LLLGMLFGLGCGVVLAVALGPRSHTLKAALTIAAIERHLNVPVLAIIDHRG